jgi:hypothetical protein
MMIGIVGLMISCMKGQEIYTKFKAKYNKKETLRSTTPLGEETSILVVDLKEEEEEEEVWVEVEDISSVITTHNQDTWQGTVRTLVPLAAITTLSNTLSRNVHDCWLNFKRNEDLNRTCRYNLSKPNLMEKTLDSLLLLEEVLLQEKTV